jgi:hypothetical protein
MTKEKLLDKLWEQYTAITPSAEKIKALLSKNGTPITNDHIALRTYNDPRVNLEVLEKSFLDRGYESCGTYDFVSKKLFARHYEHRFDNGAPSIFISELKLEMCSAGLQRIVKEILDSCDANLFSQPDLVLKGRVWGKPSYPLYSILREESEYAAWMYVFGFRANHFTVSVNDLADFETVESLNKFLEREGWKLNISGGKIKGSAAELLEQSSTLGDVLGIEFKEGRHYIPTCYYEFARRYRDENGNLFKGFITSSANKIFESTDVKLQVAE